MTTEEPFGWDDQIDDVPIEAATETPTTEAPDEEQD